MCASWVLTMAEPIQAKADFSGWRRAIEQLAGPARESLARTMAVAGGRILRDEAKMLAPVGGDMSVVERQAGESNRPGLLRSAIYLAYKPERSTHGEYVYSVSWNAKKAPHGHLVEFGHWRTHAVYKGKDGEWYTNPKIKLDKPQWVPARPFLRPALDAAGDRARAAMMARGKERLFDLLADPYAPEPER